VKKSRMRPAAIFAVAIVLLLPRPTPAEAPVAAAAALAQEGRWLSAIVKGDVKTVASILSEDPEFTHITSEGKLVYRAEELANTKQESFVMNPTEQTVDFAGDVAIVRGINTIAQAGKTLARERFTDVFVNRKGVWIALSAQETRIAH
jgi:ketosteroid isomerase-like protein